jgi:uncharacterized membrane protein
MALETFPELATNLIYSVLCLVPGFVTLKVAQFAAGREFDLDQMDKTTWSLVGSGLSLSLLYLLYVLWVDVTTGRLALVVPIDLTWTALVAAYPLLIAVAVGLGVLVGRLSRFARPAHGRDGPTSGEGST